MGNRLRATLRNANARSGGRRWEDEKRVRARYTLTHVALAFIAGGMVTYGALTA